MSKPFEIFFIDSEEALAEVKRLAPDVREYDTALIESIPESDRKNFPWLRDIDPMAFHVYCGEAVSRYRDLIGSVWIRIDLEEELSPNRPAGHTVIRDGKAVIVRDDAFMNHISDRSWAKNRKIGDGACCAPSKMVFMADAGWACHGADRQQWFAVRSKRGPSLTPGLFDKQRGELLEWKRTKDALSTRKVTMIACVDREYGLGKDGKLLFSLPEDMAHFKQTTMGHDIIMGRKTFESIGKPLPGRQNYVISSDPNFEPAGVTVIRSYSELGDTDKELYVIGGSQVYHDLLPFTDAVWLTVVDAAREADAFFPHHFKWNRNYTSTERKQSSVLGDDGKPLEYWFNYWSKENVNGTL